jgi:16S rRNA (cytosine967-C5)-methyltransferase
MSSTSGPRLQGPARTLALEIAAEARAEWAFLTEIMARSFRAHRELASSARRAIAETVYALVRMDRRLDAIVAELAGGEPLSPLARDELKLIVHEARTGVPIEALAADVRRLVRAPIDLARATVEGAGLGKHTGIDRDAIRLSYPTWMLEMFVEDLGQAEAVALADAMNRRAPMAVRVNTVKISPEALRDRLAEEHVVAHPAATSPVGLVFETRVNAFGLSAFRDGLFEVMDEGSQLVAELVAPPPGGRVLDACAGAGGKTLALGAGLAGKGRVLAIDTDGKKLEELRRRARRAGLTNVQAKVVGDDPATVAPAVGGSFDRVLVDAPCSGLGTLRRNPEARWRLTRAAVEQFPARQVALMVTYAPFVAVGGRLVYATCTVSRQENERVIERFLAERDDFVPVPVKEIWGRERAERMGDGMTLHLYPHHHDTDGFFTAVLRRVR